jgi:hypothetical protein
MPPISHDPSGGMAMGPPPLAPAALNALRYEITDTVDHLRGERSRSEVVAIGAMLCPGVITLTAG